MRAWNDAGEARDSRVDDPARSNAGGEVVVEGGAAATTHAAPGNPADARNPAELWQALKDVRDPELPISVVDLGLIYDIRRDGRRVEVDMTFTATACPCMGFIKSDIEERLLEEDDVDDVVIHVVWDPPWTRDRMSEQGRAVLRQYGVAA